MTTTYDISTPIDGSIRYGNLITVNSIVNSAPLDKIPKYSWYVNDVLQQGQINNTLIFAPEQLGDLIIKSTVDYGSGPIESNPLTITILKGNLSPVVYISPPTGDYYPSDFPLPLFAFVQGLPDGVTLEYEWKIDNIVVSTAETYSLEDAINQTITLTVGINSEFYNQYSETLEAIINIVSEGSLEGFIPEGVNIKSFTTLEHRKTAFLQVGYWVLDELQRLNQSGGQLERSNRYFDDIVTLQYLMSVFPNIEVQESRNGKIIDKDQLINSNFYWNQVKVV